MSRRSSSNLVLLCAVLSLVYLGRWRSSPLGIDAVSAVTPGHIAVVGGIRSDDGGLENPAPADRVLSSAQIEEMVRKAVYFSGGCTRPSSRERSGS